MFRYWKIPHSILCFAFGWQDFAQWMGRVIWQRKFAGDSPLERFLQFERVRPHWIFLSWPTGPHWKMVKKSPPQKREKCNWAEWHLLRSLNLRPTESNRQEMLSRGEKDASWSNKEQKREKRTGRNSVLSHTALTIHHKSLELHSESRTVKSKGRIIMLRKMRRYLDSQGGARTAIL